MVKKIAQGSAHPLSRYSRELSNVRRQEHNRRAKVKTFFNSPKYIQKPRGPGESTWWMCVCVGRSIGLS